MTSRRRSRWRGRTKAVGPATSFLAVDGQRHDIRINIDRPLAPGEGRQVGISFLDPAGALAHVKAGMAFSLRDWREIGTGKVLAVTPEHELLG